MLLVSILASSEEWKKVIKSSHLLNFNNGFYVKNLNKVLEYFYIYFAYKDFKYLQYSILKKKINKAALHLSIIFYALCFKFKILKNFITMKKNKYFMVVKILMISFFFVLNVNGTEQQNKNK